VMAAAAQAPASRTLCLDGTLLARLSQIAFDPSSLTVALHEAVAASAAAYERWGALD
jgi:hypothetical protein